MTWNRAPLAAKPFARLPHALRLGEDWRAVAGTAPFADYEVHPMTPWNYGLLLEEQTPSRSFRSERRQLALQPWSQDGANLILRVNGKQIPEWTLVDGDSGPIPTSHLQPSTQPEELTLIPFGCARLRISMFPVVR